MYNKSLFIFRRDLRLSDNTALISALENSHSVIPAFIFDPRQVQKHPYHSENAFRFMIDSLIDLDQQLISKNAHLFVFEGRPEMVVQDLIVSEKIDAVYLNQDYTVFSQKRDALIKKVCQKNGVMFHAMEDLLLHPINEIKKKDGGVYTVYTPYMRNSLSQKVCAPISNRHKNYYDKKIKAQNNDKLYHFVQDVEGSGVKGGRKKCLSILKSIKEYFNYDTLRNIPSLDATTHLSAHHKFGTCSIREVFYSIIKEFSLDHSLIRELVWRDFFTYIGFHFPHVLGESFHKKYSKIKWDNNQEYFKSWCEGCTGFPIVDAGMRELNQTGFMHNRVRMIVASFLIKGLRIDWRWGERYFAQHLVDYDPLVNNGNWQWAASTGCDAQPYFRIFNPWLQQARYDPQCDYVKRWVPELQDIPAKMLHNLAKNQLSIKNYPAPIVDHKVSSQKTLSLFKAYQNA